MVRFEVGGRVVGGRDYSEHILMTTLVPRTT